MLKTFALQVSIALAALTTASAQSFVLTGKTYEQKTNELLPYTTIAHINPKKGSVAISDDSAKYALEVRIGDTLLVSLNRFDTQQWVVDSDVKDFYLTSYCRNLHWDGEKTFSRHRISYSALYSPNMHIWGSQLRYQFYFEPYDCTEYHGSVWLRVRSLLYPSISYIRPDNSSNQQQLISVGQVQEGWSFYCKPVKRHLGIYGSASYYVEFDDKWKHSYNNFKFDISSSLYGFSISKKYQLSLIAGYSFFLGRSQYNHIHATIALTRNAWRMIGGDGCEKPKCKWYDKVFF